jgi:formylmethanofuran dehydrogenase subunit E
MRQCAKCGKMFSDNNVAKTRDSQLVYVWMCFECLGRDYGKCLGCGNKFDARYLVKVFYQLNVHSFVPIKVCPSCVTHYKICHECGKMYHESTMTRIGGSLRCQRCRERSKCPEIKFRRNTNTDAMINDPGSEA